MVFDMGFQDRLIEQRFLVAMSRGKVLECGT